MEKTEQLQENMDRGLYLEQRIIALKQESRDVSFTAYLDRVWNDVKQAERSLERIEQDLEKNYAVYAQRFPTKPQSESQAQPVSQPQSVPEQPVSQPQSMPEQPVRPYQREMSTRYGQQTQFVPQPVFQPQTIPTPQPSNMAIPPLEEWKLPPTRQQPMGIGVPYVNPEPQGSHKSMEFKVGTVIFGVLGIAFLLVAFITFGLNYMSNVMQGVFLYLIGVVILASSELFFSKWVEKFSYCLTGLGISSLYATTMINYIYLSIFPGWAALLVTVVITVFFFFLSRKKDSGMIRIICLIGCYISLMPIHQLNSLIDFVLPAVVLFFVNLAGVYCPVKKRRKVVDVVQFVCSCIVLSYLIYLQWISGMVMWPVYILVCGNILVLHLLYLAAGERGLYRALYFVGQSVYLLCLLYISYHEKWLDYGVLGMALLGVIMSLLFRKRAIRLAPYLYVALYCVLAYALEEDAFWLSVVCLVIFAVNKGLVRKCKEMLIPDAIYTMLAALGVCLFMSGEEVRFVSYIFAAAIVLSCIIVKRFRLYHIYTSLTFGWIFLVTRDWKPFLCSILIAVLASVAIGAGFYKKNKGIRIYGLILMICVALKLIIFDFYQSSAGTRILVFFVVGILILGISFVYIFLEKKQLDKEQQSSMPLMPNAMPPMPNAMPPQEHGVLQSSDLNLYQ